MSTIEFFVPGVPAPGGSKTAYPLKRKDGKPVMKNGRPVIRMVDDSKHGRQWRQTVTAFAVAAYRGPPIEGPLHLVVTFTMPRPQGHFGTGRNAGKLRLSARPFPTTKPDLTKLLRATEDACTGILWRDDSQVVRTDMRKVYGHPPGVSVSVAPIAPDDAGMMTQETP